MAVVDNKLKVLHKDAIVFLRTFKGVVVDAGVKCGNIELTHVGFFQQANSKSKPILVGLVANTKHEIRALKVERVDRVVDNVYLTKKVVGGLLGNELLPIETRVKLYHAAGESDPTLGRFLEVIRVN